MLTGLDEVVMFLPPHTAHKSIVSRVVGRWMVDGDENEQAIALCKEIGQI
jgi:hypothetical protein